MWDTLMALLIYDGLKEPVRKSSPVAIVVGVIIIIVMLVVGIKALVWVGTLGGLLG